MKILTYEDYYIMRKYSRELWLKYCYELARENDWKEKKLEKIEELYNFTTPATIIINAKKYAIEYLKMTKEELNIKENSKRNTKYTDFIEKIKKSQTPEEIESIFMQEDYRLDDLISTINTSIKSTEEKKELLIKIKPIVEKNIEIREKKKNKKLQEIRIERDKETLNLYIEVINDKSTEEALIKRLGKERYNRCINLLKETEPDTYKKYINKINIDKQNKINNTKIIESKIKEIANYLINGIEDKNGIRNFDIIDLYEMYKEYINEIPRNINNCNLTKEEIKAIKTFFRPDLMMEQRIAEKEKNMYINGIDRINCEKDERGFPIPNTGIIIPKEEKESWFEYLETNNIPVTRKTYNAMYKRYKNKIEKNIKKLTR